MEVTRRELLRWAGMGALAGAAGGALFAEDVPSAPARPGVFFDKEARWYEKLEEGNVRCNLCPLECVVQPGERGACRARENRGGSYRTLVWGNPCACHVDPIEKKPFFHFRPGEPVFSLAAAGCNFWCKYCQNWDISQARPEDTNNTPLPPDEVVRATQAAKAGIIAFTYSEPVVFSEYVLDTAEMAKARGVDTVVVSNGFINRAPLNDLLKVLAAVKIDLKAFDEKFYREICGGRLAPVLSTLERLAESGVWFEIVYLVIPTLNDDMTKITEMSRWFVKTLGTNVPLHFTAFHPAYKLRNLPRTPASTIQNARQAALSAGLKFVYAGNIPSNPGEDTFCPSCRKVLVDRYGYFVMEKHLKNVKRDKKEAECEYCGAAVPGIW